MTQKTFWSLFDPLGTRYRSNPFSEYELHYYNIRCAVCAVSIFAEDHMFLLIRATEKKVQLAWTVAGEWRRQSKHKESLLK